MPKTCIAIIPTNMKKFLVISYFLASVMAVFACGPSSRPNYYVFSLFPTTQWEQPGHSEMVAYWEKYTGQTNIAYQVDGLEDVNLDALNESTNIIIQTALQKGDSHTLHYLKALIRYLQISERLKPDEWDYPTKEELASLQKELREIRNKARGYKLSLIHI